MMNHIQRADWEHHPHFPKQAIVLGSHGAFRSVADFLARASMEHWSRAPSAGALDEHRSLFLQWMEAQKAHEKIEDQKLFPYLRARFGANFAQLELDHASLGMAEDRVLTAFEKKDALLVAHRLKEYRERLHLHLDREEEALIPMLLDLPEAEFGELSKASTPNELRDLVLQTRRKLN